MEQKRITPEQLDRAEMEFEKIANEHITVEWIDSAFFVLGSELATLRLWKSYNGKKINPNTFQGYSVNLESYYFRLDMPNYK